jgi:hypothetical protein
MVSVVTVMGSRCYSNRAALTITPECFKAGSSSAS